MPKQHYLTALFRIMMHMESY